MPSVRVIETVTINMKKYLNILSAIILGVSCMTFVATVRGQLESTRNAQTPKVISPEEAAKKYPPPAGKAYPVAQPLAINVTATGGYYRSPFSSMVYDCQKKSCPTCGSGALILDETAKKVFRLP